MKSIKLFALALILWTISSLDLMAQITMDRSLFSNLGGSASTSEFDVDFSLGEFMVGYHLMEGFQVYEGFHQGSFSETTTAIEQISLEEMGVAIFPNPVADRLTVRAAKPGQKSIHVFDNLGHQLFAKTIHLEDEVSLEHLPPGIYHLKVSSMTFPNGAVTKIIKY